MKNILITGASGDIGSKIAKSLAGSGRRLFLQGFQGVKELDTLCDEISNINNCFTVPLICDISQPQSVKEMFDKIFSYCNHLDVLVNNAGMSHIGLLQDMTDDEWRRIIDTNLSSAFFCCKSAIPGMISCGNGKIINISSIWGNVGVSCEVAYSASKGGVNSFTKALAKELAPCNIQVNAISCGVIDTKMNGFMNREEMEDLIETIPANRMGTAEECGKLVELLINAPEYLTGQIITLDGGLI